MYLNLYNQYISFYFVIRPGVKQTEFSRDVDNNVQISNASYA